MLYVGLVFAAGKTKIRLKECVAALSTIFETCQPIILSCMHCSEGYVKLNASLAISCIKQGLANTPYSIHCTRIPRMRMPALHIRYAHSPLKTPVCSSAHAQRFCLHTQPQKEQTAPLHHQYGKQESRLCIQYCLSAASKYEQKRIRRKTRHTTHVTAAMQLIAFRFRLPNNRRAHALDATHFE